MLRFGPYVWKCLLGTEVVYVACVFYGAALSGPQRTLHRQLLELLPFFQWNQPVPMLLTAVCLAVYAAAFGAYMVWMHNSSLEKR